MQMIEVKTMKWGIIGILTIGLIVVGVYGAMLVHGGEAQVSTSAYILKNNTKVDEVTPGDAVKIAVEVKNTGDVTFALSGHSPVYAYANIYKESASGLEKIQSVSFEPKYVMWHVVNIQPGKTYTAYIDWNVPENVSGILNIEAWAGSAPKTNFTIKVSTTGSNAVYDNSNVYVYADSLVYYPSNVVHIKIVNYGDSPAMFGSGFVVENDYGDKVAVKAWKNMITLQPGESVEYTWTVPDNLDSGWYYISSFANSNYETIYIY